MATLADSFLDDLDGLGEDSDDEGQEQGDGQQQGQGQGMQADMMDDLDDLNDEDDDGEDRREKKRQRRDQQEQLQADELEQQLEKMQARRLADIAKLRASQQYKDIMVKIDEALSKEPEPIAGPVEEDPVYQLIVESNEVIQQVHDELLLVYRYVADVYKSKFPELESLIKTPMEYCQAVQKIGNEMDMTKVDLEEILGQNIVMVVSVTGSTTSGQPLSAEALEEVLKGCEEFTSLHKAKERILSFVETRMLNIAPNVCAITGSQVAALLMGLAGGLTAMSKIPTGNLQLLGQEKSALAGFSGAASLKHKGQLYFCDLIQDLPPYLRTKGLRIVSGRVSLAARCDSFGGDKEGSMGAKYKQEILDKFEKWEDPGKARTKKALPKPDMERKKRRGGKRVRKMKEKFEVTEMMKQANRMGFNNRTDEYSDNAMGRDFGMLGKAGTGKLRAPEKKEQKQGLSQKQRLRVAKVSSLGNPNGLASSMVFTPVQGLELVNPNAETEKIRDANKKWFDSNSGFVSAKPK